MGGSEGAFMEPRDTSIPQLAQLQSALEDLDAAVTFSKQQSYVDSSRIVLVGFNRGGLLSVAYAGLHDGAVAGVVNVSGNWQVYRSWWQQMLAWGDFTASQFAEAGKNAKVSMLWLCALREPRAREYARKTYESFTGAGGKGTLVDGSDADSDERALAAYVRGLK
jgi:pimeloyl-ACP methyl ester carboxylesterase